MKKSIKDIKGVELTAKQMKDLRGGSDRGCRSGACHTAGGRGRCSGCDCEVKGGLTIPHSQCGFGSGWL
jgi:hypothetical protein